MPTKLAPIPTASVTELTKSPHHQKWLLKQTGGVEHLSTQLDPAQGDDTYEAAKVRFCQDVVRQQQQVAPWKYYLSGALALSLACWATIIFLPLYVAMSTITALLLTAAGVLNHAGAASIRSEAAHDLGSRPIRKIAVIGVSGAGKSHFCRRWVAQAGGRYIDLDALHWASGGSGHVARQDFKSQLRQSMKAAGDAWIVDGSYKAALSEVWGRADLVVYLNPPPLLRMWRVIARLILAVMSFRSSTSHSGNTSLALFFRFLFFEPDHCVLRHASGLDRQQRELLASIIEFRASHAARYDRAMEKKEQQLSLGQMVMALDGLRRQVPLLVLSSESEVSSWLAANKP